MVNGAQALIESLKREGVKNIFGIIGGAMIDVYNELYEETDIRHILVRHEQIAAHAADGYARALGKPGVCMATSGPGATNLVTGITTAFMDSSPVIGFTGQVPTSLIGNDAFQECDSYGLFMPITKHNYLVKDGREIPRIVKEAFYIAASGRSGPVMVDLPKDAQQVEFEAKYPEKIFLESYKPVYKGHPLQIKNALGMIADSEKPLIIAGGGVILSNASRELVAFAELTGTPVTTTLMGKGAIPEDHPLALGVLGMHGKKYANLATCEADTLIAIGCRFSDRITGRLDAFAQEARIIHIDIDPAEIGKNVPVDIPIVGDVKLVLKEMLNHSKKIMHNEWNERVNNLKKKYEYDFAFKDTPIKPQRVIHEIQKVMDNKTIITTEVGQCQMWAMHFLRIKNPRQFLSSGGLGTMGFGFPAALGAKVAKPDHHVIDVAGDGSFLMVCQDLATSIEYDIPVTVVILHNTWLGMVKQWQDLFYKRRFSATHLGSVPDFVKLAESFNANGIRVEKPEEIAPALEEARKSNVATVIDVIVDPEENIFPMVPAGGSLSEMIDNREGK